jgi:plasmid stabilization system protein ParE
MADRQLKLILSPRFDRELRHQLEWIAAKNLKAAIAADGRVRVALRRLQRFPGIGRRGPIEGTREFFIPRTRFIVAFRVSDVAVEIVALRHVRQKWPEQP